MFFGLIDDMDQCSELGDPDDTALMIQVDLEEEDDDLTGSSSGADTDLTGHVRREPDRPERPSGSDNTQGTVEDNRCFNFGKYKGETFKTVSEQELHYYAWAIQQKRSSEALKEYLDWVQQS